MKKYNKKLKTNKMKKHNRKQNYKITITYQTSKRSNLIYTQQETPRTDILRDNNSQKSSEDEQTSEDEMETTHTSET